MAPNPGRFVTFEGGEGAGKSTQAALLAEALIASGRQVVRTREPGGAPGAEVLRELLLSGRVDWSAPAETLLHFAGRAEHLARLIRPALAAGQWVICDRFYDSTMAYQGYGQQADRAMIAQLSAMMDTPPDLTLVLDVPPATMQARLAGRGAALDRYEREGAAFQQRVREGFLSIAAADPARCVVLSGEGDPGSVHGAVLDVVRERLGAP
jgi:dTMP kinase